MTPEGIPALEFEDGVFNTGIFQYNIFFDKKTVSDPEIQITGIQDGVACFVLDQQPAEMKTVKRGKVDMFDSYPGMQFISQLFGYYPSNPVLAIRRFQKYPAC